MSKENQTLFAEKLLALARSDKILSEKFPNLSLVLESMFNNGFIKGCPFKQLIDNVSILVIGEHSIIIKTNIRHDKTAFLSLSFKEDDNEHLYVKGILYAVDCIEEERYLDFWKLAGYSVNAHAKKPELYPGLNADISRLEPKAIVVFFEPKSRHWVVDNTVSREHSSSEEAVRERAEKLFNEQKNTLRVPLYFYQYNELTNTHELIQKNK